MVVLTMHQSRVSSRKRTILIVLKEGLVPFILGILLALVQVVPSQWVDESLKFWISVTLAAFAAVTIGLVIFYADLREYRKLKSWVRVYYRFAPRTFKYTKYRKILNLSGADGEVTYTFAVKNISTRTIHTMKIPTSVDIYYRKHTSVDIYYGSHTSRCAEVLEVRIGTHEVSRPEECYEKVGILNREDGTRVEEGALKIPFGEVGGLAPNEVAKVLLKMKLTGAYLDAYDKGEYTGANIYHPMDSIEFIIKPQEGDMISLNPSDQFSMGVEVWDRASNIVDHLELENVPLPKLEDNALVWFLREPKVGYSYRLRFKIIRGQRPQRPLR